jgi:ABC-type multidrug transport system fused ATPase/permease subunit
MRIARELLRYPLPVFAAAVSLVGLGATQLALPWVIKEWLQGPVAEGGVPLAEHVLAALAIVGLLALFIFASRTLLVGIDQRLVERLRSAAVDHVLRLEPGTIEPHPTGDVMSRVLQDAALLTGFTGSLMKQVLGDGFLAVGALFMMFLLHFRLALAGCVLAAVVVVALWRSGRVIRGLGVAAQRQLAALSTLLQEQLQGFTTIKGYQTEAHEAARFSEVNRSYRDTAVHSGAWSAALVGAAFLLAAFGFVAAVWLGSQQVAAGRITVGTLLAFCLYAGLTVEPLRRLADVQGVLQRSLPAAERLFELLDLPLQNDATASSMLAPSTPARSVHAPRQRSRGIAVEFARVHFRYLPDQPLLEGVDLRVEAGERIAVVAASGGGKTTLASLLLRFRDPSAGRILLDGVDLRSYPIPELRRLVCVVEQKPFLFSGPLIENLRYGSWDTREAEVWQAVDACGLRSLVERHPLGIDAPLRELGGDLSAGERQRIALARAIVKNPALLVLDEATSAIDSQAEAEVFAGLEAWLSQMTVILMAHRLSTVRRVPRIVVLAAGRVSGDGTLDDLAGGASVFATLFSDQLKVAPEVSLELRATEGASP